ncbi:MAG: hypothetical protein KME27_16015 [Lyngbya sp. HA4199-MV5]|jgi:hypothetical protein|nr:hypothetical protein [Lyngbya sp. HA4199-MV5]
MAAPSQTFERLPGKAGGLPDLVTARVPAPSLVCWGGRDNADTARFWS